jgi:zinc transport system substrate-binding protein
VDGGNILKRLFLFITALALFPALAGCAGEKEGTGSGPLTIYTTVFPLEDFTKKIGGEHVRVETILPPGTDAHTYEPSTKTMMKLADGDAFIYSGAGIEGFAEKAEEVLKGEGVKVIKAAEGIELEKYGEGENPGEEGHEHGHEHHDYELDPHVWIDPVLCIRLAENIKDALVDLKPEQKSDFEQNYAKVKKELESLDREFHRVIDQAPHKQIIVTHAAYGYWEKRYGIQQLSITGLSPSQEPSQKQLARLADQAKKLQIRYVIFEENVTPKVAEVLRRELKAESLTLHNLETITEKDRKTGKDYFKLMRENLQTLQKALYD